MSNHVLFKGYTGSKPSRRYQTKRAEEVAQRNKEAYSALLELEKRLNDDNLIISEYQRDIDEKRYKSLLKLFKVEKTIDLEQERIPFRADYKTIIFIRKKHCFKDKWIKKFGRNYIEFRIKEYEKLLHKKPENAPFWNPFPY